MKNTTVSIAKKPADKISPKKLARKKNELLSTIQNEKGKMGWILLWLIGVPVPVLLILFLIRGCT